VSVGVLINSTTLISVFAFNRSDHLKKTLDALLENDSCRQFPIHIHIDGPRNDSDLKNIESVSLVAENFKLRNPNAQVFKKETNFGLKKSIFEGVSKGFEVCEQQIILEDDIVTSPHFLDYICSALEFYQSNQSVYCISGYTVPHKVPLSSTFFLKGADCWGWATWKDRWSGLELNPQGYLDQIVSSGLAHEFDFESTYPYTKMLEDAACGKNQSWAISWYAYAFLQNGHCLYPGTSLIQNIGNDSSGTHAMNTDYFDTPIDLEFNSFTFSKNVESSELAREQFRRFFKYLGSSFTSRFKRFLSRILK
jgi:hypothetical protein